MTAKKVIEMIDEYLLEPNNISKEWVECLQVCRQVVIEQNKIVKCRKCKYSTGEESIYCELHDVMHLKPDDFCSYGERGED